MKKNKQVMNYHYQPDIDFTVIYWSFSLGILLAGVIIILEKIDFSWLAAIFIVLGLSLIYFGSRRSITIHDNELAFNRGLPILEKNKRLPISMIRKLSVGTKGFTLYHETIDGQTNEVVCLMCEKSRQHFIHALSTNPLFDADIIVMDCNKLAK